MGTRSTLKIRQNEKALLSLYQQYDGYSEGVGKQILTWLDRYSIGQGVSREEEHANGVQELALFYVLDNKTRQGNIYATTADDVQEYNYTVDFFGNDPVPTITVTNG